MTKLLIKFDPSQRAVQFSGPGTYNAKDLIKTLGRASWDPAQKAWRVSDLAKSEIEVRQLFGEYELEVRSETAVSLSAKSEIPTLDLPEEPASARVPKGLSVGEFVRKIRDALQGLFPDTTLVYGVIDSVNRKNDRVFISLADPDQRDQSVSCVIWSDEEKICRSLHDAGFTLEKDLQVMFRVRVSLSQKDARVSLTIVDVVAEYTVLKLAAQRELTNKRLVTEGIFARNKQQSFPFLPERIGILTSATGTVINDFRNAIEESQFGFRLYWINVSVQGLDAKHEIIRGLRTFGERSLVDVVVLIRGGGSAADLSLFNDYDLARAICLCPVPVLSAIGHQADQSSSQDVSFRAFGVPRDIGRFFCDIVVDLRTRYAEALAGIKRSATHQLTVENNRLTAFSSAFVGISAQIISGEKRHLASVSRTIPAVARSFLSRHRERIRDRAALLVPVAQRQVTTLRSEMTIAWGRVAREGIRLIEASRLRLERYEVQFRDLSPEVQLRRGFTLVRNAINGQLVAKGSELKSQDGIEVEFQDGKRQAIVK